MYSTNNRVVNSRAERGKQEERVFIRAACIPPTAIKKKKTLLLPPRSPFIVFPFVYDAIFNKRPEEGHVSVKITLLSSLH